VVVRQIFRVVLWMSGALLAFSAMAISVRALAATLTIMEILAIPYTWERSIFGH
jgi:hypothetical protein